MDTKGNVLQFKRIEKQLSDGETLKNFIDELKPEHVVVLAVKDGDLHCFSKDILGFELTGVLQTAVSASIEVNGQPAQRP